MPSIARAFRPMATRAAFKATAISTKQYTPFAARAFSASAAAPAKKYTKDHEWIDISADNKTGTIGISNYAAHALGDVVYVELPTTPMEVTAGDSIGAVESVKSASDINSPITCTIVEVNSLLEETPGTINKKPEESGEGGGWVAKVEVGEEGIKGLEDLMDEAAYSAFTEE